MAVPIGITFIWTGTHLGIPAGWSRKTELDGKYPKAWGTENPSASGGSNTHTHTAANHSHTLTAHSHNVVTSTWVGPANYSNRADDVADNHYHGSAAIGGTSAGSLQDYAVTWSSVNSEPPYYEVIFITPSTPTTIADDVCGYWNEATAPNNFAHCNGTGTPDLRNKYLKGAATDQNAGATGGGTSHQHSVSHTHTVNGHTHTGTSATWSGGTRGNADAQSGAHENHTHTINLSSTTDNINSYTKTDAGASDTVEVSYKKIGVIQNTSGTGVNPPVGIIALWLGTVANLPSGWVVCDGTEDTPDLRDYFIKVINTTGEIGSTAGANTHSHTTLTGHTHTATGTHTHSGTVQATTSARNADTGGDGGSSLSHTHTISTCSSTTATYGTGDITGPSTSHQPAYLTAAYVQYQGRSGGSVLALLAQM